MVISQYDHKNASKVIPAGDVSDIKKAIEKAPSLKRATPARVGIMTQLRSHGGWSNPITLCTEAKIKIPSQKGSIGLCLQSGNMSRVYADLLKLEYLHSVKRVHAAVFIVPTTERAKSWGQNIANYERLVREIPIFKKIINVPILVLGIPLE